MSSAMKHTGQSPEDGGRGCAEEQTRGSCRCDGVLLGAFLKKQGMTHGRGQQSLALRRK